jgi:hypothetical protein
VVPISVQPAAAGSAVEFALTYRPTVVDTTALCPVLAFVMAVDVPFWKINWPCPNTALAVAITMAVRSSFFILFLLFCSVFGPVLYP